MSIPLTGKPLKLIDGEVTYLVKAPVGVTEIDVIELQETLPTNKKQREEMFTKNKREASQYIDKFVDIILSGWESNAVKLPPFPASCPSQSLKSDVKVRILSFYNNEKALSEADLKNY